MKKLLATVLFFATCSAASAADCVHTREIGRPTTSLASGMTQDFCNRGYESFYSHDTKTPLWVAETVDQRFFVGKGHRSNDFRADDRVAMGRSPTPRDYAHSGFAKGHMVPAGDFDSDPELERETFLMTNMVPQVGRCNNSGDWAAIEKLVRDMAVRTGPLTVVTGPVFSRNGERLRSGVKVPDYMFKVVLSSDRKKTVAFLVPNAEVCGIAPTSFVTTQTEVERISGWRFFPRYPNVVREKNLW